VSRLDGAFVEAKRQGRTALICYLMAGVPSPGAFLDMAMACLEGGADVLEVGIPFSDPIADGPVIQEAGVRALENGVTPPMVLDMVRGLRERTMRPIVLMGYYNPIFRMGEGRFVSECVRAGADGLIVPDLPLHESASLRRICAAAGLDMVQLSTPLTSQNRHRALMEATSGFLYMVTRTGVTGAGTGTFGSLSSMVERSKLVSSAVPLAAGFGISTPGQVRTAKDAGVDGVIVGSALVVMTLNGSSPADIKTAVSRLSLACGPGVPM